VFKSGEYGVGYYLDFGPSGAVPAEAPSGPTSAGGVVIRLAEHIDFVADFSPPVVLSLFTLLALQPDADRMQTDHDECESRARMRAARREVRACTVAARGLPHCPGADRVALRLGSDDAPANRPHARRRPRRRRHRRGVPGYSAPPLP
jgi:hypothetical protein